MDNTDRLVDDVISFMLKRDNHDSFSYFNELHKNIWGSGYFDREDILEEIYGDFRDYTYFIED